MEVVVKAGAGGGGVEDRCGTSPYRSRSCCTRTEGGRRGGTGTLALAGTGVAVDRTIAAAVVEVVVKAGAG
jgi:hypothetical protein